MAASRKAASATPASKAPSPMRMPGAPCNATLAPTCWQSFLCFVGLPLEGWPCGCLHAALLVMKLLRTCESSAIQPLSLLEKHLDLRHCDAVDLMGCKPCTDRAWLENLLVMSTGDTQFARRHESIYVLADNSPRVQFPAAEPSSKLGQAV